MSVKDTYDSIASVSEGLFKDKGSRFIAKAFPVGSETDVKSILGALGREYHDARHICYAYRLGRDGGRCRANDDGEPSGTAGRQILARIESAGLSDILVVVIRYFGGILLGVPGLTRAYRTAASEALAAACVVEKTACAGCRLGFGYESLPAVMDTLKSMSVSVISREFGENCTMEVSVRESILEDFLEKMKKNGIFIDDLLKEQQ